MLANLTGPICNLDCEYCFFLSKEQLYPGDRFRMADEMLETYLRQLLESHRTPDVTVAWQGGEPTMMGLDFFKRAVELIDRYRRPDQRISHTIQTNGTLIDDRWAEFLKENDVLVGLSVDGPEALHDADRVDPRGEGSFHRAMMGFDALRAHDVDVNVLCTVHAANVDSPLDVYRFFRGPARCELHPVHPHRRARSLQSSSRSPTRGGARHRPRGNYRCTCNRGTSSPVRTVALKALGTFLNAIFDEWLASDVGEVFIQHFDTALANWHGEPGAVCVFSETCGLAVALEHNGDLYSCDHYVEPDYLLGNIAETTMVELIASPKQVEFGQAKRDTLPEFCRSCDVRFACHGGCPKNRFTLTPDGAEGLNYLCPSYKAFFHHIDRPMKAMSQLLRDGRAPSEAAAVLAAEDAATYARTGRNDPCPCGSGTKFKNCHGDPTGSGVVH